MVEGGTMYCDTIQLAMAKESNVSLESRREIEGRQTCRFSYAAVPILYGVLYQMPSCHAYPIHVL